MVLVTHDPSRQSCQGSDSASLIASVRCAIASEVPFAVTNLSYRVLGDSIVSEGNVIKRSNAELIHRIAEDIAGHGRVILGVGGINL
ncbi:hypothetical protein I7F13_13445 [Sinorhizobium meliloti]|uniref:hypothetical protein n=1 Tax=Rhizobium meliloti TaxID=382 RepID=UPI000FDAA269|nr:hypothetical protein [Sinorhizobium meliloti]MDE3823303.1 hypothetical protein [Sinorhizobium meliloti]RVM52951.1 hypothetical protein CN127_09735 [Sinorhizobium meliloti]RVN75036.1 hypothetical protein CN106_02575 [Sinorhizobium meliloti]RVO41708.1 hypothetical protein CN095_04740 [Sinorhizobium meliloti]